MPSQSTRNTRALLAKPFRLRKKKADPAAYPGISTTGGPVEPALMLCMVSSGVEPTGVSWKEHSTLHLHTLVSLNLFNLCSNTTCTGKFGDPSSLVRVQMG